MKKNKDEEKTMGPMFPRLHVNDTDKGGPRAPPRNKMALYEQLSIPSQRFNHSMQKDNTAANLVPPLSQGGGNERRVFFSSQLAPGHQIDTYNQYSDFTTPLAQVERREKSDEDDFRVPIFNHAFPSQECRKYTNDMDIEKVVPSNTSYFSHSLKFSKAKDTGMLGSDRAPEENQRQENSKGFVAGHVNTVSNSLITEKNERVKKQTERSQCHEQGDIPLTRFRTDDILPPELCAKSQSTTSNRFSVAVLGENIVPTNQEHSPDSLRSFPSGDKSIVHDSSNVTESHEGRSFGSMHKEDLERGDSVSETSILDSISGQDMISPDDVVGIIGQKHFWKARRAITNQQRVFAVQVFELHRLIKVQRLIAASPNLLLEDSAYSTKTMKALPVKEIPLSYPVKPVANLPNQKGDSDEPSHKKEGSAENTLDKASLSSSKVKDPPSNARPLPPSSPAPSINSDHYPRPLYINQQRGQQWLIPVMTPSEGLVYKPYPVPGFINPGFGGCGPPPGSTPMMGNFMTPACGHPGLPSPYPQYPHPQYPHPQYPFPPAGYYPQYGMPMMNTSAFSGSSVEQTNPPSILGGFSGGEAYVSVGKNLSSLPSCKMGGVPNTSNLPGSGDVQEVQGSSASSPSERLQSTNRARPANVLPLFPTSPPTNSSSHTGGPQQSEPDLPSTRVIKVVPHNARTATESAARIFQSIQKERKQV